MVTSWYDDPIPEELLQRFKKEWLVECGPHDFGLMEYGCNCPTGDPRWVISRLIQEITRLQEIEARMKDLEK